MLKTCRRHGTLEWKLLSAKPCTFILENETICLRVLRAWYSARTGWGKSVTKTDLHTWNGLFFPRLPLSIQRIKTAGHRKLFGYFSKRISVLLISVNKSAQYINKLYHRKVLLSRSRIKSLKFDTGKFYSLAFFDDFMDSPRKLGPLNMNWPRYDSDNYGKPLIGFDQCVIPIR